MSETEQDRNVHSPIIIVGPTIVGKSALAHAIADRLIRDGQKTHIIGADKFYLYSGPFQLGLGLEQGSLDDGRQRHLYGTHKPEDPCPTPQEYATLLKEAVRQTHALGALAIIEGCSKAYTITACRMYGYDHALRCMLPYGYKNVDPFDALDNWDELIESKVTEKLDKLIEEGLYDETIRLLNAGYENTYPMRKGLIYGPIVDEVSGRIQHGAARQQIISRWIGEANRSRDFYTSDEYQTEAFGPLFTPPTFRRKN